MIRKLFMYIILGIIQGITEPIPVSSSGHLVIFRSLLSNEAINDLNFEIILNFGSFIAIVIFFWNDIKNLLIDFHVSLCIYLICGFTIILFVNYP